MRNGAVFSSFMWLRNEKIVYILKTSSCVCLPQYSTVVKVLAPKCSGPSSNLAPPLKNEFSFLFSFLLFSFFFFFFTGLYFNVPSVFSVPTSRKTDILSRFPTIIYNKLSNTDPRGIERSLQFGDKCIVSEGKSKTNKA